MTAHYFLTNSHLIHRRLPPPPMVNPPHRAPRPRTGLTPYSLLRPVHPLLRFRRRPSWWPLELPVALWAPFIAAARVGHTPLSLWSSPVCGETRHKKVERGHKGEVRGRVSACVPSFFASNNNSPLLTAALSSQGERRRPGGGQGNAGGSSRGEEMVPRQG